LEENFGLQRSIKGLRELSSVLCLFENIYIYIERERVGNLRERERERRKLGRGRKYGDGYDDIVVVITGFLFSHPWFPTSRAH
jgi:hypothetical protein